MECYKCNNENSETIEMANINQWGNISEEPVFICQNCREKMETVKEEENPDYYDYAAGIYLIDND